MVILKTLTCPLNHIFVHRSLKLLNSSIFFPNVTQMLVCENDHRVLKPEIFTIWSFQKKFADPWFGIMVSWGRKILGWQLLSLWTMLAFIITYKKLYFMYCSFTMMCLDMSFSLFTAWNLTCTLNLRRSCPQFHFRYCICAIFLCCSPWSISMSVNLFF